jgi:UDP:flavonoid glycosyltransferase YjiC (YdhE family)
MTNNMKLTKIIAQNRRKVIFGALDWGLGHATRSIPILRYIQQKGGQISIAASGPTAELLKNELPEAEFLDLPGYGITYPGQGGSFRSHIFRQIPKIRRAIRDEGNWLRRAQEKGRWDLIISDNRYGFRHPGVPSIFITHQLAPISGMGSLADALFRRTLYHYINRFTEVWVPDMEKEPSLAGQLSHPDSLPKIPVRYIGLLSRLDPAPTAPGPDLLILLSGPEPQRTILEKIILEQWNQVPGSKIMVRGRPEDNSSAPSPSGGKLINHLPAHELAQMIAGAGTIVCRPGYSSLMDLLRMNKRAILIPTPGQTEQELLAQRFDHQKGFIKSDQDALDLGRLVPFKSMFNPADFGQEAFDQFKKAVDAFVF